MTSDASSPNITQSIGTNTGSVNAVAAGRDAIVTQQTNQAATVALTQDQAVELLQHILTLIKTAELPDEALAEAESYAQLAQTEAKKPEPNKSRIVGNLEGATDLIKKLSGTTDAAKDLIVKLKDPMLKLAGWLGVAAVHFFG